MLEYFAIADTIVVAFAIVALVLAPFMHRAIMYSVILGFVHCAASLAVGRVESAVMGGLLVIAAIAIPVVVVVSWRSGSSR